MAAFENEHADRIALFQSDLRDLDIFKVIRKHITTGPSAVFTDDAYYELRNEVADHFRLHPSAVVLVGSGRTGFSLSPNKRYRPFSDSSDVDIAIISRQAFDSYWDLVFEHWRADRYWAQTIRYRKFLRELFKGWLWPRHLPPPTHFEEARKWAEFEDRLGKRRFRGIRSVGARLYRSWHRLEAYQSIHVADCKNALILGKK
jgi:hypothetical protein